MADTDIITVIKERRSIREFSDQAVSADQLNAMIEAARLAPSGTNRQPWRFLILDSPAKKERINNAVMQPFVLTAPVIIVCCLDKRAYTKKLVEKRMTELVVADIISQEAAGYIYNRPLPEQASEVEIPASAYLDLGIAVEHMILTATALGLGSCWIRLFKPEQVHEEFQLSADLEVVALLPVGHPVGQPQPRPRLPQEEIIISL